MEECPKSDSDSDREDESGHSSLLDKSDDQTSTMTSHSRSRQMNVGNLDAKVVKALKKQEEKREKRALRKKEVRIMPTILSTMHTVGVKKVTFLVR